MSKEVTIKPKSPSEIPMVDSMYMKELVQFNQVLDRDPSPNMIKTNQFSNGAKYVPIRAVETMLRTIFGVYQVEMIGQPHIVGNSVVVSVHLKVYHPVLKEWVTYAGTGAVPIQVEQGAHPTDFTKINSKALHKNVPAAKSFAVSNAAKSIGRIFGSHVNSTDDLYVTNMYEEKPAA